MQIKLVVVVDSLRFKNTIYKDNKGLKKKEKTERFRDQLKVIFFLTLF